MLSTKIKVNIRIDPSLYRQLHIESRKSSRTLTDLLSSKVLAFIRDFELNQRKRIETVLAYISNSRKHNRKLRHTVSIYLDEDIYNKLIGIKKSIEETMRCTIPMSELLRAILLFY